MTGFQTTPDALRQAAAGVRGENNRLDQALQCLSGGGVSDNSFGVVGRMMGTYDEYTTRLDAARAEIREALTILNGIGDRLERCADSYEETEQKHVTLFHGRLA